jgi:glycerol-3-phosphate acyltransferase PlsY
MDILLILAAFLLGSVPFAQLMLRGRGLDLRVIGSGNVGAANLLRVSSLKVALAVLALDASKGGLAVWASDGVSRQPSMAVWAGLAAIVGHIYPPWLGFRGGKGMATTGGVFLVLAPLATAGAALVFVGVVWWSRFVSLGSLCAMVALPPLALAAQAEPAVVAAACAAVSLVGFRHRSNIRRLIAGTERRLGQKVRVN